MSKKTFKGKVIGTKMKNTVVVLIERKIPHPTYGKLIKRSNKLMADLNGMDVKVNDYVVIEETKPISKNKNFKVLRKEEQVK